MNLDKVNKPNVQMNEEQRRNLQNVKNNATQKINQGTSFVDSNLLSKFKNKNFKMVQNGPNPLESC